jgi:predicted dehydrogenase
MAAFTGNDPFIWEQGVHSFNSLLAITGRSAISVFSRQLKPRWSAYNGPTTSMGVIELDDGVPCDFLGTFESRSFTMDIRFEFEQAAVRLVAAGTFQKRLEVAPAGKPFAPVGIEDAQDTGPAERFNLDAFHRGCTEGGRVVNDGRDNLRTLAVVDAFIRSSQSGQKEKVRQF